MTYTFSICIWRPPISQNGKGSWVEASQAWNEDYALYAANLIHLDSKAVIKVVRFGINIASFLDEHAVELVERQIVRQQEQM